MARRPSLLSSSFIFLIQKEMLILHRERRGECSNCYYHLIYLSSVGCCERGEEGIEERGEERGGDRRGT